MTQFETNIDPTLPSTRQNGAPAESDRNSLTVGSNGPIVLHDVQLVETLSAFNRERVPERNPHAKGAGAFGELEITEDVSQWTRAKVFQKGSKTRSLLRFSTVAGEQGSPDTWRDVRGFALKFYTEEGNLDIVGNNTPVFFLRDPMKFPHFIRSQKRLPDSGLRNNTMQYDFWTNNPESAHQVTYLMGDRGLPRSWREMNGYSSHTYSWINEAGEIFWVKYHWISEQGVHTISNEEAERLAGEDADFHRRDLFDAIERGEHPSWTLKVQVMPYEDAKQYRYNPFDLTKVWPHSDYPLHTVGRLTLNENPENFFAQIEQAAFAPSNYVPGTGISPDKMLMGRMYGYADAHRYRIGTNFAQLPVNRPIVKTNSYTFDGNMRFDHSGSAPVYAPNSYERPHSDETGKVENNWTSDGDLVRSAYALHPEDDDFGQPGKLVREVWNDEQRAQFVETVAGSLATVEEPVLSRAFQYWKNVDAECGDRIQKTVLEGRAEAGEIPGGDPANP
ncbi:catalase [Gulosibacter sp. 10]|uniref:catalase n=1 Tax=Gulosibacter sp. 10 TaxID=1255570 RepID=UPI00097F124B|nr:catalase [Gulosibacter sp. 10]SJM58819.1 Catalase [Gulosibacter sp. 10]